MKGQGLCGTDGISIQKEIERKKNRGNSATIMNLLFLILQLSFLHSF